MRVFCLTLTGLCALVGSLALVPSSALACEPPACRGGFLVPESGSIPANAPGLVWSPHENFFGYDESPDYTTARLTLLSDGEDAIAYQLQTLDNWGFLLTPDALDALDEGTYRFHAPSYCELVDDWEMTVDFTVGPAAADPTTLGDLVVEAAGRELLTTATAVGSCAVEVESTFVDLGVALSDEAQPWGDLLLYTTWIDLGTDALPIAWNPSRVIGDSRAPGASWIGRGQNRLFAQCEPAEWDPEGYYGLPEGDYPVFMTAELAGSDVVVETSTVVVRLDCEAGSGIVDDSDPGIADPAGADVGGRADDVGFVDADAGSSDAGSSDADAGAPDLSLEVNSGDTGGGSNANGAASGCGCRAADGGASDPTALWLCIALLVALSLARKLGAQSRR